MSVVDASELTDDEWREQTFDEETLISARLTRAQVGGNDPTLSQLKGALDKYGPEGILESAVLLPRKQYEELAKLVRKAPKQPVRHRARK